MTDKLKELVSSSDIPEIQKNILNGFIERANLQHSLNRELRLLVEQVASEKKLSEIILSTDDVIIYTVKGHDEWSVKYPYRSIYLKGGKWHRTNTVSPNLEVAFLIYLEYKYLGAGSQFSNFAMKMLEITID